MVPGIAWHNLDKGDALKELKSSEDGITNAEAAERLKEYGKNEITQVAKINPIFIFLQQFKSIFIIILLFAAIFSLFIEHYIDFAVIFCVVLINSMIGFFQQYKAEKTISELRG